MLRLIPAGMIWQRIRLFLEQVRTIDKQRLKEKVCHMGDDILKKVDIALKISLDLY
jgi:mRNA interferase MazF